MRRTAAFTRCEINLSKRERVLMSKLHESEIHRAAVRLNMHILVTDPSIIEQEITTKRINHKNFAM